MKLHLPLGLRKAVFSVILATAAAGSLPTMADDTQSSYTETSSILKSIWIDFYSHEDYCSLYVTDDDDDRCVAEYMANDFTLYLNPQYCDPENPDKIISLDAMTVKQDKLEQICAVGLFPLDEASKQHGTLTITPIVTPEGASKTFELNVISSMMHNTSYPFLSQGLVCSSWGELILAVPILNVKATSQNENTGGLGDTSYSTINATGYGSLEWTGKASVGASLEKTSAHTLRFAAVSACGYDDVSELYDSPASASRIKGNSLVFSDFSLQSLGDVSAYGLFANMSFHCPWAPDPEDKDSVIISYDWYSLMPTSITMTGDVVMNGDSSTLKSEAGRSSFVGLYAAEGSAITLEKSLSITGITQSATEGITFAGVRSATEAVVTVDGGIQIHSNGVGDNVVNYAVWADGGMVVFSQTTESRCIEGDMVATVGKLYKLHNADRVEEDGSPSYRPCLVTGDMAPFCEEPEEGKTPQAAGSDGILTWGTVDKVYEGGGWIQASFSGQTSSFTGFTHDGDVAVDAYVVDLPSVGDKIITMSKRQFSQIDLSFTDGAVWNVVSSNVQEANEAGMYDSRLTTLNAESAHIYVGTTADDWEAVQAIDDEPAPLFATKFERLEATDKPTRLTVDTLTGAGSTFYLRADIDGERADQVVVDRESKGAHQLMVKAVNGSKAQMDTFLVQSVAGDAAFTLANPGGVVEAGVHTYELATRKIEGAEVEVTEWFLRRAGGGGNGREGLSPTGEAVLAFSSPAAQESAFLNRLSDLRGRLGEIRDAEDDDLSGKGAPYAAPRNTLVYAQALAGHDTVPGFSGCDYRSNYWGGKVGANRRVSPHWMLGAEFNTAQGKQRLARPTHLTKGESESYGLLLSGTWSDEKGRYCDIVFGLDRYEQDVKALMLDGTTASGSYSSWSPALSIEGGRKYLFGSDRQWFFEPQAQLVWYMAGGDDYTMSNGVEVSRDDTHSLTGRLGFALGKMHRLHNGDALQWHVDAGVKHEFMDDPEVTVDGNTFKAESLGTRFYYGVGADWWLNQRSKLYGTVQREEGSAYRSDINARVGYSYSF